jgi:hypothetical protein
MELEKLPTLNELEKINFVGYTHGNIWTLTKEKVNWVKKVRHDQIRKLNWILGDELVMKEMVNSYNHVNQYVKLKGRQIDVGKEGVARSFGLSHERVVQIGRESYNPIVATYFTRDEYERYISLLVYLIAKVNGKHKVAKLEALIA